MRPSSPSNGTPSSLPPQIGRFLLRGCILVVLFLIGFATLAGFAPMASTLQLTGTVVSQRPEVLLQHRYGGPVAAVRVVRHDLVAQGAELLRLDTRLEQQQRDHLLAQQARLLSENSVLEALIDGSTDADDGGNVPLPQGQPGAEYLLQAEMARIDQRGKRQTVQSLGEQIARLEDKVALVDQQRAGMIERAERHAQLIAKKLQKRDVGDTLAEQILMVEAELQTDRGDLEALQDRRQQIATQADLVMVKLRERLISQRARNKRQLEEVGNTLLSLEDRIAHAVIRAPMPGMITQLQLEAENSYAQQGKTLIALAQPLAHPHLDLMVPPIYIDQLQVGMAGRLVLPSLPQRAMPQIIAQITAISPRADLDEYGQPQGYSVRADLTPEAAATLQAALADLRLSEDMPVQLIVEVRQVTLAQYVWRPFAAALSTALQD